METNRKNSIYEYLYLIIFPVVVIGCLVGGLFIQNYKLPLEKTVLSVTKISNAQFLIEEPVEKIIPEPVMKTETHAVEKKKEIIDLTEKPLLSQTADDIQQKSTDAPVLRKVYGLRKVYSTGLGAAGRMSDAVIGKLGNTLNAPVDTFTASRDEIMGQVVSTTTITTAPQFLKIIKPEYNREMLENKTEGVVKVRALVDIDGKVKKATLLNDLGFDSGAQALKATLSMEFIPAKRGTEPVAVWIVIPVRFVMLG